MNKVVVSNYLRYLKTVRLETFYDDFLTTVEVPSAGLQVSKI